MNTPPPDVNADELLLATPLWLLVAA